VRGVIAELHGNEQADRVLERLTASAAAQPILRERASGPPTNERAAVVELLGGFVRLGSIDEYTLRADLDSPSLERTQLGRLRQSVLALLGASPAPASDLDWVKRIIAPLKKPERTAEVMAVLERAAEGA
jgi:hypothetical protein